MKMTIRAAVAAAAFAFAPMAANAVTFALGAGAQGQGSLLAPGAGVFSLTGTTGLSDGDALSSFNVGAAGDQIIDVLDGGFDFRITATYLGSEAGFKNSALRLGDDTVIFQNKDFGGNTASSVGDMFSWTSSAGSVLDFAYATLGGDCAGSSIGLDGTATCSALNIATFFESADSIIVLFGDNTGDVDSDDLAVRLQVSAIPVPAGFLLLGTAFAAAGAARRFGRKADV